MDYLSPLVSSQNLKGRKKGKKDRRKNKRENLWDYTDIYCPLTSILLLSLLHDSANQRQTLGRSFPTTTVLVVVWLYNSSSVLLPVVVVVVLVVVVLSLL